MAFDITQTLPKCVLIDMSNLKCCLIYSNTKQLLFKMKIVETDNYENFLDSIFFLH